MTAGDALDFWRVQEAVPGRALRLRAEMKLPGVAEAPSAQSRANGRGP